MNTILYYLHFKTLFTGFIHHKMLSKIIEYILIYYLLDLYCIHNKILIPHVTTEHYISIHQCSKPQI